MPNFDDRMQAALRAPKLTDAQATAAGQLLMQQQERLQTRCGRNYFYFLSFAAGFTILGTRGVSSFTLFGVTISREQPVTVLLFVLAAYCLYQSVASAVHAQLIAQTLRIYWRERMKPFYLKGIVRLFEYPTPFVTEDLLVLASDKWLQRVSTLWMKGIIGALALVPTGWFLLASYWVVRSAAFNWFITVCALVVVWVLLARSAVLVIQLVELVISEAISDVFRLLPDWYDEKVQDGRLERTGQGDESDLWPV